VAAVRDTKSIDSTALVGTFKTTKIAGIIGILDITQEEQMDSLLL
jgi:hypothetical protein